MAERSVRSILENRDRRKAEARRQSDDTDERREQESRDWGRILDSVIQPVLLDTHKELLENGQQSEVKRPLTIGVLASIGLAVSSEGDARPAMPVAIKFDPSSSGDSVTVTTGSSRTGTDPKQETIATNDLTPEKVKELVLDLLEDVFG